jgi:hypothetical protein
MAGSWHAVLLTYAMPMLLFVAHGVGLVAGGIVVVRSARTTPGDGVGLV